MDQDEREQDDEIRKKRHTSLLDAWEAIKNFGIVDGERFVLSIPLLEEVVEYYCDDIRVLRKRYGITQLADYTKVAGLMMRAILRFRPVLPNFNDAFQNEREVLVNELYAIFHALAILAEDHGEVTELSKEEWFEEWVRYMGRFLHKRNYTPDGLIAICRTLSIFRFPEILKNQDGDNLV